MKQRLFTTLLILFSMLTGNAQDTLNKNFKRIGITNSISDYLPTGRFAIAKTTIGIECYLKNKISVSFSFGKLKSEGSRGGLFGTPSISSNGYKIEVEGRKYLGKHTLIEPLILFLWPHIFQYKTMKLENAGYYFASKQKFQYASTKKENRQTIYSIYRDTYCTQFNAGYKTIRKYGLTIDFSIGLEFKYINFKNKQTYFGADEFFNFQFKGDNDKRKVGSGFYSGPVFDFRLGWSF